MKKLLVLFLAVFLIACSGLQISIRVDTQAETPTPTSTPTALPPSRPTFIYPVDGQTLDYGLAYLFKVAPVPRADGYLWSFFQNGEKVWENLRDEGVLSRNDYGIQPGTEAHSRFSPGEVKVWVRAYVDEKWTEPAIIAIQLR